MARYCQPRIGPSQSDLKMIQQIFTIFDLDQSLSFSDGYNAVCAELVIKAGIVHNRPDY